MGPAILGYGSSGTVVYEGCLDGRQVAVKRLLRQFTELARKEIEVWCDAGRGGATSMVTVFKKRGERGVVDTSRN